MSTIKPPCHDFRGKASTPEILPHRYYDRGGGNMIKRGECLALKMEPYSMISLLNFITSIYGAPCSK